MQFFCKKIRQGSDLWLEYKASLLKSNGLTFGPPRTAGSEKKFLEG
jgi:hypothetical protein